MTGQGAVLRQIAPQGQREWRGGEFCGHSWRAMGKSEKKRRDGATPKLGAAFAEKDRLPAPEKLLWA